MASRKKESWRMASMKRILAMPTQILMKTSSLGLMTMGKRL
jgi:hypothetical protein